MGHGMDNVWHSVYAPLLLFGSPDKAIGDNPKGRATLNVYVSGGRFVVIAGHIPREKHLVFRRPEADEGIAFLCVCHLVPPVLCSYYIV